MSLRTVAHDDQLRMIRRGRDEYVLRLREQGLLWREIAEHLGRHPQGCRVHAAEGQRFRAFMARTELPFDLDAAVDAFMHARTL